MSIIFYLTLPFFALVGLGFLAAWLKMFEANAVASLNTFVFNFAMPALVITALAPQDFSALVEPAMLFGWLAAAALIYGLAMIVSKFAFGSDIREMALMGQAASVSNVGFLAIPLIASAFGPEAIRIPAALLVVDLLVIIPFSLVLIEAAGGGTPQQAIFRSLKGAVVNPFCIAISIGVIFSATGVGLPGPTERFAEFLAGAAGPTALFALGLSLSGRQIADERIPVVFICVLKLIAHPLLAYGICLSLGVSGLSLALVVVVAAMPVAGNVFVIAEHYGVMVKRGSTAVLVSTILATLTVAYVLGQALVLPYLVR
ncbi:MAG: AEC family transporter [Pseudomonadota bacterium]